MSHPESTNTTLEEIYDLIEQAEKLSMEQLTKVISINPILEIGNVPNTRHGHAVLDTLLFDIDHGLYDEQFFKNVEQNSSRYKMLIAKLTHSLKTKRDSENFDKKFEDTEWQVTTNNIKHLILILHKYIPDFKLEKDLALIDEIALIKEIEETKKDKRTSPKAPSIPARIKALKMYCPELFKTLIQKDKQTQERVIHQITGANKVDSYKFSFGDRQKQQDRYDVTNHLDDK